MADQTLAPIILEIPFPPRCLHPNAGSAHWSHRVGPRKRYKRDCFYLGKTVRFVDHGGPIKIKILWHPKTKNQPDEDGAIANLKAAFDGLALAWGVDDQRFKQDGITLGEPVKGGKVILHVQCE